MEWLARGQFPYWLAPDEGEYSLDSVIHLFMSRLHQSYRDTLLMPTARRKAVFELELKVIENEEAEASNRKSG